MRQTPRGRAGRKGGPKLASPNGRPGALPSRVPSSRSSAKHPPPLALFARTSDHYDVDTMSIAVFVTRARVEENQRTKRSAVTEKPGGCHRFRTYTDLTRTSSCTMLRSGSDLRCSSPLSPNPKALPSPTLTRNPRPLPLPPALSSSRLSSAASSAQGPRSRRVRWLSPPGLWYGSLALCLARACA